jgi:hypothetical protein
MNECVQIGKFHNILREDYVSVREWLTALSDFLDRFSYTTEYLTVIEELEAVS